MRRSKKIFIGITSIATVLGLALVGGSMYLFHVAEVRAPKHFAMGGTPLADDNPYLVANRKWLKQPKTLWYQTTPGGLKLDAFYIANPKPTNKTIVIAHGFGNSKEGMGPYGQLFLELGYNVLIPDDRAHGASQGKIIGFGWNDRKDYVRWINQLVAKNPKVKIAMFGVSMGGATTMMTAGEKLPSNVKAFIEDCGYDSVYNEVAYQAKAMYHLPAVPIVPMVSLLSQIRGGYSYKQASSIKQLHKNKRPMMFIHGGADTFVPTEMVYKNYAATQGPKELWVAPAAPHGYSFIKYPTIYRQKVQAFLANYFN